MTQIEGGIYGIINTVNGHIYIGSSRNIMSRWRQHRKHLNMQIHHSLYLQKAWNKYGSSSFALKPLLYINDLNKLIFFEQIFLDKLKPQYNVAKIAGSVLGIKRSAEFKNHLSNLKKGQPGRRLSESSKDKLRKFRTGQKLTDSAKLKLKIFHTNRKLSEETKNKIKETRHRKSIAAFNKNNTMVLNFNSILDASKSGFTRILISRSIKTGKPYRGLYWRTNA